MCLGGIASNARNNNFRVFGRFGHCIFSNLWYGVVFMIEVTLLWEHWEYIMNGSHYGYYIIGYFGAFSFIHAAAYIARKWERK